MFKKFVPLAAIAMALGLLPQPAAAQAKKDSVTMTNSVGIAVNKRRVT